MLNLFANNIHTALLKQQYRITEIEHDMIRYDVHTVSREMITNGTIHTASRVYSISLFTRARTLV